MESATGVAILGLAKGDYMVTLSPVRLDIQESSPQFELLKNLPTMQSRNYELPTHE